MSKSKILIVDDSVKIRQLIIESLTKSDYDVVDAASGEPVLDMLKMQPDIALILMDIDMPGMNGFDTMKTIRSYCREHKIKVCFVTAMDEKGDVLKAIALGASAYLTKPIKTDVLLARVKQLLEAPYVELSVHLDTNLSARVSDQLKIDTEMKIKKISPAGFVLESMFELRDNLLVKITCPKFVELFQLKTPVDCEIISCTREGDIYLCESFFVDPSSSMLKKIKKLIALGNPLTD